MAWTEQCKIAFTTNADVLYWKQKGRKNKMKVLRTLSKDAGIPLETLKRWWKEADRVKNDPTETTTSNNEEKRTETEEVHEKLCEVCKVKPVRIQKDGTKHNLCSSCANKKAKKAKLKWLHQINGHICSFRKQLEKESSLAHAWNDGIPKSEYKDAMKEVFLLIQTWEALCEKGDEK